MVLFPGSPSVADEGDIEGRMAQPGDGDSDAHVDAPTAPPEDGEVEGEANNNVPKEKAEPGEGCNAQ